MVVVVDQGHDQIKVAKYNGQQKGSYKKGIKKKYLQELGYELDEVLEREKGQEQVAVVAVVDQEHDQIKVAKYNGQQKES